MCAFDDLLSIVSQCLNCCGGITTSGLLLINIEEDISSSRLGRLSTSFCFNRGG